MGKDDFTEIPNGGPGIEHRMSLVYSGGVAKGRFSVNRFVEIVSTTPAKLFGLYPRKGTIAVGSDADIALWDPEREVTLTLALMHDAMDYTPYEGLRVRGWPVTTLSRGEVVAHEFEPRGSPGRGRFLPCARSPLARPRGA